LNYCDLSWTWALHLGRPLSLPSLYRRSPLQPSSSLSYGIYLPSPYLLKRRGRGRRAVVAPGGILATRTYDGGRRTLQATYQKHTRLYGAPALARETSPYACQFCAPPSTPRFAAAIRVCSHARRRYSKRARDARIARAGGRRQLAHWAAYGGWLTARLCLFCKRWWHRGARHLSRQILPLAPGASLVASNSALARLPRAARASIMFVAHGVTRYGDVSGAD